MACMGMALWKRYGVHGHTTGFQEQYFDHLGRSSPVSVDMI
jgi:hypothetical protein